MEVEWAKLIIPPPQAVRLENLHESRQDLAFFILEKTTNRLGRES